MRVKVDRPAIERSRRINTIVMVDGEWRTYYLLPTPQSLEMLIVLRNGLQLEELLGSVVDARVGWDIVHYGYGAEEEIGQRRSKITIYKRIRGPIADKTLSQVAEYEESP